MNEPMKRNHYKIAMTLKRKEKSGKLKNNGGIGTQGDGSRKATSAKEHFVKGGIHAQNNKSYYNKYERDNRSTKEARQ